MTRDHIPTIAGKLEFHIDRLTKLGHEVVEANGSENEIFAIHKARELLSDLHTVLLGKMEMTNG